MRKEKKSQIDGAKFKQIVFICSSDTVDVNLLIPAFYSEEKAIVGDIINLQCLVSTNYTDDVYR